MPGFEPDLEHEGDEGEDGEQRRAGEGGARLVFVVEHLDVQRQGVGLATDVAGDDRYGTEFAHRAGVAQQHAVQQPPLDVGQGDAAEDLPAARPEGHPHFLLVAALGFHQRDQLARHEREGDEHRRQQDARQREDDFDFVGGKPRPQPALAAEEQDPHQAGDHRGDRERQVDEGQQPLAARKAELGDGPRRSHPAHRVEGHGHGGGDHGEPHRVAGALVLQGLDGDDPPLAQSLHEHRRQRQEQQQPQHQHRRTDQEAAGPDRVGWGGGVHRGGRGKEGRIDRRRASGNASPTGAGTG